MYTEHFGVVFLLNFDSSNLKYNKLQRTKKGLPYELEVTSNELEVKSIINSLNTRKAFGSASIPTNFLKLFKDELSKPISLLANISLHTSMFPNILKTANVTPIFKNDDVALCNNYQPISILPT